MKIDRSVTALITGANGGIGMAIARALHQKGAAVLLHARRAEAIAPLAKELQARVLLADLADREQVRTLCQEAGAVDFLIANAALASSGDILSFSEEEIDRGLEVNLRAPMQMARILGEGMAARGRGQITFISSVSGLVASANTSVYSATKFGLRGFSLGLRADMHARGVGVTTVFPGFIRDAGMFAETGIDLPPGIGTRSPEEVAEAVLRSARENPAEIVVASPEQRFAGVLGSVAPGVYGALERLLGSKSVGDRVSERQRHKR